jgi:trans-aconitate methyltransferase
MDQTEQTPEAMAQWDAKLYAQNTAHHRQFDAAILQGVDLDPTARVLDLGCGSGDFTATLAGLVPEGSVLGVDADPDMVRVAAERRAAANTEFQVLPAQRISTVLPAGSFDAVLSVATLHWIPSPDHAQVLAGIARILRPGGLFRAEFGGAGQIAAARSILDEEARRVGGDAPPWCFPEPDAYRDLLTAAGFQVADGWVRLLPQRRSMPDRDALIGWLRSQVLVGYDSVVPASRQIEFRAAAEQRAGGELRRADGTFDQDYVRLDLRVQR